MYDQTLIRCDCPVARLYSTVLVLNDEDLESGEILTRSLFELTVNMAYVHMDATTRLPEYLRHGGIPVTMEEAEELEKRLVAADRQDVKEFVPRSTWTNLSAMCKDLGPDWVKEYETFYRIVSVTAHAGSFKLGMNIIELLEQRVPSDTKKATILLTALDFHLRVETIAASLFPTLISPKLIRELRAECGTLGQSLVVRDESR